MHRAEYPRVREKIKDPENRKFNESRLFVTREYRIESNVIIIENGLTRDFFCENGH